MGLGLDMADSMSWLHGNRDLNGDNRPTMPRTGAREVQVCVWWRGGSKYEGLEARESLLDSRKRKDTRVGGAP